MRRVFTTLGVLAGALAVTATAQTNAKVDHRADDHAITKSLEDAQTPFNNHDAKAFAKSFATDGDLRIPNGELVHGRVAIEGYYIPLFAGRLKNAKVVMQPNITTRYLNSNIAFVEGAEDLTGVMSPDGNEMSSARFLFAQCYVKRNGTWQILIARAYAIPTLAPVADRGTL